MLEISEVTVNYLAGPSGVIACPQIGWKLVSDNRNTFQTNYRLIISKKSDFSEPVYDSGLVDSCESAHIRPNLCLEDIVKYFIKVEVHDCHGESAVGSGEFISGFQNPKSWPAQFISAESDSDKDKSSGTLLRKEFYIEGPFTSAYFFGTAHGMYIPYLNGNKIGNDNLSPGWTSYNKHLRYQIYDISSSLLPGLNTLGISLGAGWYKGKMSYNLNRNHYGKTTAFSGGILLHCADGSVKIVASDLSWKASASPVVFSEIYDGEIYDARMEQLGWNKNGFDDILWKSVRKDHHDLNALKPSFGGGIQIMDKIKAIDIFTTPQGDRVVDFGQNLSGWCQINIRDASAGDRIVLKFFETLDSQGNVYTLNLRSAKQTIQYTCAGGDAVFHPNFTYHGFRYAQIIQWPGQPKPEDFTALVLHSAMPVTGSFSCSDSSLNQLQHNILWSMKGNFLDVPTDCPQRDERLGWTGDVQIFNSTANYLMNTYAFYSKWLVDVACDQTSEGAVPHVVPDIITGKSSEDWLTKQGCSGASAWADVCVMLPWNLYMAYGDTEIITQQYSSMKRWIDFMTAHSSGINSCLFSYMLQFGDWLALDAEEGSYFGATPTEFTCAAFYCHSTLLFSKMAAAIGKDDDALKYGKLAQELQESFVKKFFAENGQLTVDTQTAQILAVYFDLVPGIYRKKLARRLKELLDKNNGHLTTGFIGTPYICHALSDNGYLKDAYDLLLRDDFPSWLYQVKKGATTIWEHWDGLKPDGSMWSPDMNSFNHYAYGSIGDWMYKNIGGLRCDESAPGYKHFILSPKPDGRLTEASAAYDSIYGPIKSAWNLKGDQVELKVCIPVNTTADIVLEDAAMVLDGDGLVMVRSGNALIAKAGSGEYRIKYRMSGQK